MLLAKCHTNDSTNDEMQMPQLCRCVQVLLHGCIVSEQNVDMVLEGIRKDLEKIETSLANSMLDIIPGHRDVSIHSIHRCWSFYVVVFC